MHPAPQETRTYFVTAITARRRPFFQSPATAALLQQTLLDYCSQGKFLLHAWVIMPDHVHALITPASDVSLEKAMQFIKGGFSFRLQGKQDIWTRSFNESQILTQDKFEACTQYIEQNPVRKALAPTPQTYPYSSASQGRPDPMPSHFSIKTHRIDLPNS